MSDVTGCFCDNVQFQTYDHVVGMKKPFKEGWERDVVPIDVCIATEIAELWHKGVVTLNSCCGHQKMRANVVVPKSEVKRMGELGYTEDIEIPSGLPCFLLKTGTQKSTAWRTTDHDQYVEVVPIADLKPHLAGDECWCNPKTIEEKDSRPIVSHNALDKRKTSEENLDE